MKGLKIFALLLALTALSALTGCRENRSTDYLSYQKKGASFLCKITQDTHVYTAALDIGDGLSLTFREPETMAGYRFSQTDGQIALDFDGLEISTPDAELPRRVFALFSLSPGDFLSASEEKISGENITVVRFIEDRLLRLSSDGRPLMLEDDALTVDILPDPPAQTSAATAATTVPATLPDPETPPSA